MLSPEPIRPAPPPAPPPRQPDLAAPAFGVLVQLLARARARQARFQRTFAACVSTAGLLAVAPLVLLAAAAGFRGARFLALLAVAAAASLFLVLELAWTRRRVGDLGATARLVAGRVADPALRRGLLPAFELGEALSRGGEPDFSPCLADAHIDDVARAVVKVDLTRALPDRLARVGAWSLLAGAAVFCVFAAAFRDPMARGARALVAPAAGAVSRAIAAEPITGEIELTYTYPAYMRRPPRTVPNTSGEVAAPRGTQTSLKTRADRDLDKALVVVDGTPLPLAVTGRDLAGGFLVQKAGSYRFRFLDRRDNLLAEGPPLPIALEEDRAPKASILAPVADLEVDPKSRVALRWEAEDDHGLSEIALLFKLPGTGKAERVVLERPAPGARRSSGDFQWDLVAHGLMAGDHVAYYVEATDADEVSGRKSGASRTQVLKVFSEAEQHRQVLKRVEELWERLVAVLGDRLEGPDRAPGRPVEKVAQETAIDGRVASLATELGALARDLRKQKAPERLWRAVSNAGTGLSEKAGTTSDARTAVRSWLRNGLAADSPLVRRFDSALAGEIALEERDVLYLETLVDQQKVEDLIALAKELATKRRELAERLERYRTAPDDASRERIGREIARLKERMMELMQRMAELSKSINDEHVNAEALKDLDKSAQMLSSFDQIQDLLNQGKVEEAMKELEKLGEMVDGLQKSLERASGSFNGGAFQELGRELTDFARDLDDLKVGEEDLLKETQSVRDAYKKGLKERLERKGDDFVKKLREKVDRARKKLRDVPDTQVYVEQELRAAREDVEDLDRALAVGDFDQAAQSAAKALDRAQRIEEDVARRAADAVRYPEYFKKDLAELKKGAQDARIAKRSLEEVKAELDQLFPSPSEILGDQDRQKMRQLAERQGRLGEQAKKLGGRMEELGKKAPLFPQQASQMMKEASQRMGRAQGQLSGRNPTGAAAEERAALDQLSQLKKGLEQQRGGAGPGGVPWPWMGPGSPTGEGDPSGADSSHEKVQIPGAEQHKVPDEFRKDILDAMKQGSPEKYRDQVKRYYEEIVK